MPISSELRTLLVGYGYAGKTFHAPLLQAAPGIKLTHVASSQAEQVKQQLGANITVLADYQAAVQQPDIALVVIASPNDSHAPLAELALRAGKHVVVDKPFALTFNEAKALTALATEQKLLLSVFHNRRFDADFLSLQHLLNSGQLGQVAHLESRFDRFRPQVRQRWREQAGPGAGLWFDLGPHLLDQSLVLFGLPHSITASLKTVRPDATATDWFSVQLDYGHFSVTLGASMLAAAPSARFTLQAQHGSWQKFGLDIQEEQLKQGLTPAAAGWGIEPQPGLLYQAEQVMPYSPAMGCYQHYYAAIVAAINGKGPNPVPPQQACTVMQLLELAEQSAAEGRTLAVAAAA
ncbi:oxidoreductase [Rheinheimera sp. NSM]|uniref:oxidoreductase n=1 Tax=Rheinheimera sp. NSM TaxID=3457884 RepID=UPI00403582EA